jgi:uncharacterized NAD(P)/FAD-binding protein YdhS
MTDSVGNLHRVAIVGGGASGAVAAAHLLREPRARGTLEIELIDRTGTFGAGVAYATEDPLHLLNVPAVRMGAVHGRPEHFHEWLLERGEDVPQEAFLPRGLFGAYLRDLLERAEREATDARLHRRKGEVLTIAEREDGVTLGLAEGEELVVDQVVLATGPLVGGDPIDVPAALRESGAYIGDPWIPGVIDPVRAQREVLMIGTGLTMVDVALSLGEVPGGPTVRTISRHGLIPRRNRRDLTRLRHFPVPTESGELGPMVAAVLTQIAGVAKYGEDWRDVIDSMRPETPALWRALALPEKRRFLTELNRFWDVHRFRMAPDVADRMAQLEAAGRFSCGAASIVSLEPHGGRVRVLLHAVGATETEAIEVDSVINCTGAGIDLRRQAPPVLADLLAAGTARPDDLGMGLDVDEDGALIGADGRPSERLFAIGSLRKGVEWEAIGITEIRDHSGAVARRVAGRRSTRESSGIAFP